MDSLVLDDNPSQATVPFIMYIVQGLHLAASFLAHDTFCLDSATKVHICEIMRFGLVTFSAIAGHVELGLIVCRIRYPHSRMRSIGNMVRLHLFFDCSHIFIFLPFIPVIFTDYFGSFRCLWTDTYRGQNGYLSYMGHSIHIQEEFIAICLERVILEDPTGVVSQELSRSQDKFLLLPFTLKIAHSYQL